MIEWHNTLLRSDSGGIAGTLSSGQDVTEQLDAEEGLRRSETRYREAAGINQRFYGVMETRGCT